MSLPRRALLSTWDKRGVDEFARGLAAMGFEVVSTGGTGRHLTEAGVAVTAVSDITGFAEILDGRVKTLHPAVHAGILARRDEPEHLAELERRTIAPIDIVAVNLYPFSETVSSGAPRADCVEMIDIGGPTMIRAAAKNNDGVWVVVDPDDYQRVLAALAGGERADAKGVRNELAAKAFAHTAEYDRQIAAWIAPTGEQDAPLPARLHPALDRQMELRYGENPHQAAAVYRWENGKLFGGFRQLQGKQLSYNNLLDIDAARGLAWRLEPPAVAIIKHNNPCGVGTGSTLEEAYRHALACDPVSAFGSIVGVNGAVDGPLASALLELFVEVVVSPGFDAEARELLATKTNLRLIEAPPTVGGGVEFRSIDGGLLAQERDDSPDQPKQWNIVSQRQPTDEELAALQLAWTVSRSVRSNAIVIANAHQTVGIGAGQMSRVDSCRIAIDKAVLDLESTVAASDAFFPFADGVETLAAAGVTAVVQPGGSRRDDELVATADRLRLAMLTTGRRQFRH